MPNTQLGLPQLKSELRNVDYHYNITAPANGTYDIALEAGETATIEYVVAKLASGTCTIEVRINNVAVVYAASATTIAVTSTKSSTAAVSSKTIATAASLQLVVSGVSSPVNLSITIHARRSA
jgi:microcystin-dependent protein